MKILLIAINAKYIHSSLSVWYLKNSLSDDLGQTVVREFTINDSYDRVFSSVYLEKPDILAFSCYIWNMGMVRSLVRDVHKVLPKSRIILGGPEASYDSQKIIVENPEVDYILSGEGEVSFNKIISGLVYGNPNLDDIPGLSYRIGKETVHNKLDPSMEALDNIPSPYTDEMLQRLQNRIIYFESSRGCPYSCSYCLSSITKGVKYLSLDETFKRLDRLVLSDVRQIKFVDRTFNCNSERASSIFSFIIENYSEKKDINFHFEAAADLFDQKMLDVLSKAPEGLIQLEIGIQTVNAVTLESIDRKTDLKKAFLNIEKLVSFKNMHIHLDLIAGLPYEDYESFKDSFNTVYLLRSHHLQLGFLKLLKGSKLRGEAKEHGFLYREEPPYEILCNKYISCDEMIRLKSFEEIFERYYNSGRFSKTLEFLIDGYFETPFSFYEALMEYWSDNGHFSQKPSGRQLYTILLRFGERFCNGHHRIVLAELLKFDYLSSDNSDNLPEGIKRNYYPGFKEKCFEFLKDESNLKTFLCDEGEKSAKQIYKKVHFEPFNVDVLSPLSYETAERVIIFDYNRKSPVTGLYEHVLIKI